MIHLDTNYLIAAKDPGTVASQVTDWLSRGIHIGISTVAWTEFLCGPVSLEERLSAQAMIAHFEPLSEEDSALAAYLFNQTGRRRGSLLDCMIAAIAIRSNAMLATLNVADFAPMEACGLSIFHDAYS